MPTYNPYTETKRKPPKIGTKVLTHIKSKSIDAKIIDIQGEYYILINLDAVSPRPFKRKLEQLYCKTRS